MGQARIAAPGKGTNTNGKTSLGYLWVAHRPVEDVLFEWHTSREAKCLEKLIPINFSGTIQCDGYSAYDRFARDRATEGKPVLLAGCWARARRGFYEALDHAPKEAGWILIQIGHLYDIDRTLRGQRTGPALRDAYRTSQSIPIRRRLKQVLQRWYITRRFLQTVQRYYRIWRWALTQTPGTRPARPGDSGVLSDSTTTSYSAHMNTYRQV
jgi:Transposase IS66 family